MNKSAALYIALMAMVMLLLNGCELFRTEQGAQGEIGAFTPPEAVQANTMVRLQAGTSQLEVGQITTVDILVENVVDLFALDIQVQFAPTILQVQDADPTQEGVQIAPGDLLSADFVQAKQADNTIGLINYVVAQTAPNPPFSGSGVVATFTVRAVAPGESVLTFSTVKLANPEGQEISTAVQNGQISVVQTGQATATTAPDQASPTPTTEPIGEHDGDLVTATPTITPTIVLTTTPTPTAPPLSPTPTFTPLPPPPSTPTPPPLAVLPPGATVGFCYRVQKGDTLSGLAERWGSSVNNIQRANDLYPPGYIYIQKALFIPTQMGGGPNFYITKAGDTLDSIAQACNLPADFLAWVNKLDNGAVLGVGQALEIPIPPFPPPAAYPYPQSGPFGPPSVYPPPAFGPPVPYGRPCQSRCGW